jgi:hypothetical protein
MSDATVKVYRNTYSGAPASSGITSSASQLITVLDACLVNGFGSVTLTSLVVTDNVATGTVSGGHGFTMEGATGPVITVSGATPSGLNGDWRIATIPNTTTFTFATSGITNQTATGTIAAKRAAAGWEKVYSGTNKAVYRPINPASNRHYLRVSDGSGDARVVGYVTMSSVDAGTQPFPTATQISGGAYVHKSDSSTPRAWNIFANDRFFYFISNGYDQWYNGLAFGDLVEGFSADAYATILSAANNASDYFPLTGCGGISYVYLPREIGQTGTAIEGYRYKAGHGGGYLGDAGETLPPAATAFGVRVLPIEVWDSSTVFRGLQPGAWDTPALHSQDAILEDFSGPLAGSTLVYQTNINYGFFIDITGPWH